VKHDPQLHKRIHKTTNTAIAVIPPT
jgi:hypothetical protein